ncbi:MAG: hypothetical protein ABSE73_13300 [Planctomycetota bacterium]
MCRNFKPDYFASAAGKPERVLVPLNLPEASRFNGLALCRVKLAKQLAFAVAVSKDQRETGQALGRRRGDGLSLRLGR